MNMKNTVPKESKFARYMKGPIKVLARARDFYVHSIAGCANNHVAYYGNTAGCPTPCSTSLLKSFSANSPYNSSYSSRDEEMRDLIRIASTRGLTGKTEADLLRSRKSPAPGDGGVAAAAVTRIRTIGIGRIDEDKPCEFGGNDVGARLVVYPGRRSYAEKAK